MHTKAAQKLGQHLEKNGNSATKDRIANGQMRYDERVDYARKDLAGLSGTVAFIDETFAKEDGTRSIHQGRLPQNVNVSYDKILVQFKVTTSAVAPAAEAGYSSDVQSFDDALRNGIITIRQDDAVKLELPISVLGTGADSDRNPQEIAYKLNDPIVLEEGKLIEVEIKLAGTVPSVADTSYNAEIALFGVGTASKG